MEKQQIRCAIYTRKSTEEGLEQSFNSLDAQRDSCEAYIKSQTHEGWKILTKHYDDGGYSGGTMNRPAFQELLKDIEQDKIDIVVVYKVDRLTRSLMDFSKIVDVFDKHNTSFVSITQHFNTTTSMGRLTLNILLSFAQFEREVTGERIRDKFAASAKKGLWITGATPLGYKKSDDKLIVDQEQSWKIITIFEKYLELKSVTKLKNYLDEENICTRSGKVFSKGNLYHILSNKVYLGKIVRKENTYNGQHEPLIPTDIFNEVQAILYENNFNKTGKERKASNAFLQGKLFDRFGNYFSPACSTGRGGKKYFYYINQGVKQGKFSNKETFSRIPTYEIEKFVQDKITEFISEDKNTLPLIKNLSLNEQEQFLNTLQLKQLDQNLLRPLINKVTISEKNIEILLSESELYKLITGLENKTNMQILHLEYNVKLIQSSRKGRSMVINNSSNCNKTLIDAIVKGFYYNKLILEGKTTAELQTRNARRLRKLRFLPPKLIEQIFTGTQDADLTVEKLCNLKY